MQAPIFPLFLLFSLFPTPHSSQPTCPPLKCTPHGPEIRHPFGLTPHCGKPGFTLSCKHNATTTIHFSSPSHHRLDLTVKSISYDENRVDLSDPRRCVHGVFLDLDLSLTPFQYAYTVKDFTYLNCSTKLPDSFDEVACLSGKDHHVYTVEGSESGSSFEEFCRVVKSVRIPFGYSPYLADDEFGLGLTWKTECGEEEEVSKGFLVMNGLMGSAMCDELLKFGLIVVAAALLVGMKMYYHANRVETKLENEKIDIYL